MVGFAGFSHAGAKRLTKEGELSYLSVHKNLCLFLQIAILKETNCVLQMEIEKANLNIEEVDIRNKQLEAMLSKLKQRVRSHVLYMRLARSTRSTVGHRNGLSELARAKVGSSGRVTALAA